MSEPYSIPLHEVTDHFGLKIVTKPDNYDQVAVFSKDVTRPGLPLAGFFGYYDGTRIEVIGKMEHLFLSQMEKEERASRLNAFFARHPVAVILTSGLEVFDEMLTAAQNNGVTLLCTTEDSCPFIAALIAWLSVQLAPCITRHGVLVEVYGEGILILGDSGIGKSETAIELVKRGHRLIADDAVEIRKVSATTLVGSAPELIRHYVELRGVGIVDIRRIFGMGAVKETEKINLVINLEQWVQGKLYDRLGLDQASTDIMGIEVPTLTIPVRPGRNLAIIIEIAAMNNRQRRMGINAAEEFNQRVISQMGVEQ
ncbi:MAG: HPr(Ser) kinase/phosphatase [Clostridia bacterium]|nr:HPr(Ser) kinase/phosphatase [Clostridia bacterium]